MIKKKLKNQKPIDTDAHFRYRCPKLDCGFDHWLSLKQCKTKGFRIVCDCGCVFKPKRIAKIKIVYVDLKSINKKSKPETSDAKEDQIKTSNSIPIDFQNSCVKVLVDYGFTKEESISLCEKAFEKNPVNNAGLLIKYILQNLEILDVNN
jgi:hypothetical protein